MSNMWIYDAVIYVYALSLICYFSDLIQKNRRAQQAGTGLLVFVWLLQFTFFIVLTMETNSWSLFSMFETLFLLSWLVATIGIIIQWRLKAGLLALFIHLLNFFILILNMLADFRTPTFFSGWEIQDGLLFVHIVFALGSYAVFLVAAILSGVYLFLHHRLKLKKWTATVKRLPGLGTIDKYAFRLVMLAFPMLILSVVLGIVWILLVGETPLLLDPKVLNSLLILAAYAYYVILRWTHHTAGYKLAIWNLAAFASVIINYFLSNYISEFHQWIWM